MTDKEILVERVARAIYLNYAGEGARWDCVDPHYQETVWRNHARAAIASMPHSEQVEGWQPIETAPRELNPCLLFTPDIMMRRDPKAGVVTGRMADGHPYGDGMNGDWEYTHWRPFPKAPALTRNVSDKE